MGKVEAETADSVANQLFNLGITPINIDPVVEREDPLERWLRQAGFGQPTTEEMILFSRQMYTLTKSGVPLVRGFKGLADSTRNRVLRDAILDIIATVESGRDLATAFSQHPKLFSPLYVNVVRVGENSGQLEEAFLRMYQYLSLDKDIRDKVKTALRYPTIVVSAIIVAIFIVTLYVVPAFARVFSQGGVELPWATQVILATSAFMIGYWHVVLAALVGGVFALRMWLRTEAGRYKWDRAKFRLPIIGDLVLRASLARFARSFAVTYRSGVPLIQALSLTARSVDNEFLGERVLTMRTGVERGESLHRSAAGVALFTPLVLQMIAVGEETGKVDDMLDEVAGFYEREVAYDLDRLATLVEPALIVAVGIMVLILALGVFLPMWELSSAVGRGR
jgi:MSHA biogenesis protein MshG